MRDSTGEISGDGYLRTSSSTSGNGDPAQPLRMLENPLEISKYIEEKLRGERVFFEQQVTGELLLAAKNNVIDDIAYQTLLKFFEERGLTEQDLRRRKVTIRYSVEPV